MTKKRKIKTTQKVRIEQIKDLLEANDEAVESALLEIYSRQTADEQATSMTIMSNGVGFTGVDAEYLTKMAEWVRNDFANPPGKRLVGERLRWTRHRMKKYAKQLAKSDWYFCGSQPIPATPANGAGTTPATGPESRSAGDPPPVRGSDPPRRFTTRTDALEDTIRRIETGRAWLRDNRDDSMIERAESRLIQLAEYAERLVDNATREDLASTKFRHLARYMKPCPDCSGTQKRESGQCFRCRGKGFQTTVDENRNARYDARKKEA